jgi:hypothetical protein
MHRAGQLRQVIRHVADVPFGMRHARADALDVLEEVLSEIRGLPGIVEKSRGVFYRRSRAFLHFHEDPTGLHADVRIGDDFERHRVESDDERHAFVSLVVSAISDPPVTSP